MMIRRTTLAVAISMAFSTAYSYDAEHDGKRIDNARVDMVGVPEQAEMQPDFAYPLPSGVTRAEAAAMRTANASLPTSAPALQKTLEDRTSGALFESGKADLTSASRQALDELIAAIRGKPGLRIAISGHTDNQRLSPNSKKIFGTNQGLSEARSLAVAAYIRRHVGIDASQIAIEGHGESKPIADNNMPEGMQRNRRVEVKVWFEGQQPAIPVAARQAACSPPSASDLDAPFRITIDGEPVQLTDKVNEADLQRCTDVALEKADIQVRYDSLAVAPAMNVWATPHSAVKGEKVEFRSWSNYIPWIVKSELRLFRAGQKPQETPLAVVPMDWNAPLTWTAPKDIEDNQVFYLLRVYDRAGNFDETALKPLDLMSRPYIAADLDKPERESMTGYGENSLALRNIPVRGGTITVNGSNLKPGQTVETFGLVLPVDANGKFATKQILPTGPHTVDVKVSNPDGSHAGFRRNLTIPDNDWFYIALGDLTIGRNSVSGPAQLVTGDTYHYDEKTYVDGRGAFYLKGKIKGEYLLTAAADTREGRFKDLFSNFTSKDPRYLLRNIDPDLYYPVYGDDSTTVDDAPTQGKFYVKLERGDSHVMWGNFKTTWSGTELLQYSRGLYGANVRWRSEKTTQWGEQTAQLDAFAADPGTLGAREEHRGTGGSLYYLRHLDVTQGSERVWVESRDKDSGLVVERKELTPAQDYEINYLQGRITLRQPLSSTGSSAGLIMTSAVSGNPLYLVVTYEYVPGLDSIDNLSTGARASTWINDHLQVGMTTYHQGGSDVDQKLKGVDATLRYKPGTYVRVEAAKSDGKGSGSLVSQDGGFGFNALTTDERKADGHHVTAAVDLSEVTDSMKGKLSAYSVEKERGFSAPGQININGEALKQNGVKAEVELRQGTAVEVKADKRDGDTQNSQNVELALRQDLNEQWRASVGVRQDERDNEVANASRLLSQNGERTDAQVRLDYQPAKDAADPDKSADWNAYGFVQGTVDRDEERERNDRVGLGGAWRLNDRSKLYAEGSDGSQGVGGKVGLDYQVSDRTNTYLSYQVETENPDVAWRGRQGTWISGATTRLSEQTRIFGEARATNGAGPRSLTQAFGLDLAPNDRWNYGAKAEFGTLSDELAGDIDRKALGVSVGYKYEGIKYSGALEWRKDESDLSGDRTTWLMRNTLGVQATKAWRLLSKFNYSHSDNSQGAFFDGNYHEFVMGAAYRPVDNDRWNTLFKYTNFYNVPSPGQLTSSDVIADYAQKSQVFSVDTIYDVQPWLSLGFKYAIRIGELRATKTSGEWFDSRADLFIVRTDWHWVKEWDGVVEFRNLRAEEAEDARAGFLVAAYRHVGNGLKAGIGYNFTDYSDDLTDLSYKSRGWFINLLWTQ